MIIVTGGAGFIGSAIIWMFNKKGIKDIIVCDELGESEKWKNLRGKSFSCYVHKNDLFDKLKNTELRKNVQCIIHMGACSSTTETNMDYLYETNTKYTMDLIKFALEENIRIIYASSAAVYGDGKLGFSDSDDLTPKLMPLNKYGFSKWLVDNYVVDKSLSDKVVGLRFFNVFGPNEYHKNDMSSVIFKALPQAMEEGRVRLFESHIDNVNHGEQKRDFIYIKDVVNVIDFFVENKKVNGIFNVGTGNASSFNELAQSLLIGLNKEVKIDYFSMPDSVKNQYQYFTQADISKLRNAGYLGDFTNFKDAVLEYVRDYLIKDNPYL